MKIDKVTISIGLFRISGISRIQSAGKITDCSTQEPSSSIKASIPTLTKEIRGVASEKGVLEHRDMSILLALSARVVLSRFRFKCRKQNSRLSKTNSPPQVEGFHLTKRTSVTQTLKKCSKELSSNIEICQDEWHFLALVDFMARSVIKDLKTKGSTKSRKL